MPLVFGTGLAEFCGDNYLLERSRPWFGVLATVEKCVHHGVWLVGPDHRCPMQHYRNHRRIRKIDIINITIRYAVQ